MYRSIILGLIVLASMPASAKDIFITNSADQKGDGSKAKPFLSIRDAQQYAQKFVGKESVNFYFNDGIYYLDEALKITPKDSGTAEFPVTYQALNSRKAILSGGNKIALTWKPYRDHIFVADISNDGGIDQLFVNKKRQDMARYPNRRENKNVFDYWDLSHSVWDLTNSKTAQDGNKSVDALSAKRVARWQNPAGGYLHGMHNALWGDMHWLITGKKSAGELALEGGWQNNRPSEIHEIYRFVENIFEELDAPGEWYFNQQQGKLYFYPPKDVNLAKADIELVNLSNLVNFAGSQNRPVKHVTFDGFTFRHTKRTFMENKEPLLRSDWTVYRGGTVMFNGAEHSQILNSDFDQVGGNAIFVNNYNMKLTIKGNYIHESGSNGIAFVGDPKSVRSPLFRYGPQNYNEIDLTKGPIGNNYPQDIVVEDNLITLTGRVEKQTSPVQISMSYKINVKNNSLYQVPRAAINVSEGTFGGHIIENNDMFDTVLETGDHGSYNSWGRDRFWDPSPKIMNREVAKNPELPYLDMLGPITIRNNRIRCDHGWDIDLDDGSSYYKIYNNLLLNGGMKIREGYDRVITNNIILNNGLHPHVWLKNSGDVFKHNIVFKGLSPAAMQKGLTLNAKWGKEIDYNLFTSSHADRSRFINNGADSNSIVADPLFVNPSIGDFKVSKESPALTIGFKNFSQEYGVKSQWLKQLVKVPIFPEIETTSDQRLVVNTENQMQSWLGAKLNIPVDTELSAYGASLGAKGVAFIHVPEDSKAWQLGFRTSDLVLDVNGQRVGNIGNFVKMMSTEKNKVTIEYLRDQSKEVLNLK